MSDMEKDFMTYMNMSERNKINLQTLKDKRVKNGFSPKMQKAKGNASIYDFIDMIAKMVERSTKLNTKETKFCMDEGMDITLDPSYTIDKPYIMYSIISREPTSEHKPRIREEFVEKVNGFTRAGSVYGQKMKCIMQFDIVACDYKTANEVMNSFEDLMMENLSYFKEYGVSECIFMKQLTDPDRSSMREKASVRSLQYLVFVEKLHTVYNSIISSENSSNSVV